MTQIRTPNRGPQLVGDILPRFLNRSGLESRVEAATVLTDWSARVGPAISAVTRPVRLSEATLFVAVSTSSWIMELNMMKSELLRHLNAGRGVGRIERLVFVMDGEPGSR